MGTIQLVIISITFLASLPSQAQGCLSENDCCNRSRILTFEAHFRDSKPSPLSMAPSATDSAMDCQASSRGPVARRSISPWRYKKDFDATRYPQNLWHASCSCEHCLSFHSSGRQNLRTYNTLEVKGNSVIIQHNTIVFYRHECPGRHGWFYLQPRNYLVNVSCACVVPMHSS
ncbi:interleukin-25 [Python bivittatus]|uniref:Interleukin-25 n=1 Tax=Python bivittatus TaxID=176946 RepID=A0A9F5J8T5_PYTBI|nr:interleukin-25 [Python bivittatus]